MEVWKRAAETGGERGSNKCVDMGTALRTCGKRQDDVVSQPA